MSREVSARVLSSLIDVSPRQLLDTTTLYRGLSFTEQELRQPGNRIDWADFAEFLDRYTSMVGGMEAFERIIERHVSPEGPFAGLVRLCLSPMTYYLELGPWLARKIYANLELGADDLGDGRVHWHWRVPPEFRPSLPAMHATAVTARVAPRLFGLPDAEVEATLLPHEAYCVITPPSSHTILSRARHRLDAIRSRISPEPLASNIEILLDETFSVVRSQAAPAVFAAWQQPEEIRSPLEQTLHRRVGCTSFSLAGRSSLGEVLLLRSGEASEPLNCSLSIVFGRQEVGRLDMAAPMDSWRAESALVDVLPLLAVGIGAWCARAGGSSETRAAQRVRASAARWKFTPREVEVVGLVGAGLQNKEVAVALRISPKTVEKHLLNAMGKAGAKTRTQLVALMTE